MLNEQFRLKGNAALMVAIAAAYPCAADCAPAARIDFAVGNVTAVAPNGRERPLAKGAQVDQGETVNTNNGRAQMRFSDGAYVSLQPQSQFRIDQYKFDGKADGSERGFFSLLKGGLRTITGLVGRTNKQNYQVNTSVATIGIRGTEYTIQYGNSISGTVGEGEIQVCNGAGCLNVTSGESYYVQGENVKPELSNKKTDLPAPPPSNPPTYFATGENRNADGSPEVLAGPTTTGMTGSQTLDAERGNYCDGACYGPNSGVTVVFDSSGKLVSYGSIVPSAVQMGGNDGIVAWGTFLDPNAGLGPLTHFVVGTPVPSADLAGLGGTRATYDLLGSTPVTNSSDAKIGTLNSASLSVNFGVTGPSAPPGTASAAMNWTINGAPLSSSLTGTGSGANFFLSGSCGGSCSVSADVALFGPNAARAGMVYNIRDFVNIDALGAAAFAKK